MKPIILLSAVLFAVSGFFASVAGAGDWPAFRGPRGDGTADENGLPTKWSAKENIAWRTPLPAPGNSSPIVWGDKVFVTGALDDGLRRTLMCFNRDDGKLLWQREVKYGEKEPTHKTNPFCPASPVTDGERVVAWHGSAGLVCYDLAGSEQWLVDLGKFTQLWGSAASSPIIVDDLVINLCGPGANVFLVALDKKTGKEVWKRPLPEAQGKNADEWKGSWSTPLLITTGGKRQLIVPLPQRVAAFDSATGNELWTCDGLSDLSYASPVLAGDTVVVMSGSHGPALAVRAGGEGNVTASHRLWLHEKKTPQRVGSAVAVGMHIYILNENGTVSCYEAASGNTLWEKRGPGKSWSSLCYVDGRIYAATEAGDMAIIEPDPSDLKIVATNSLGELIRSSPAFSDGQIFVRTYESLFCIGERK